MTMTANKLWDAIERWFVSSGALEQLAFLVTKTTLVRQMVLAAASALFAKNAIEGEIGQMLIAAFVAIATGSITQFVHYLRNKYSERVQAAVGANPDKFIGPVTLAAVDRAMANRESA